MNHNNSHFDKRHRQGKGILLISWGKGDVSGTKPYFAPRSGGKSN
jgi:hypothetical protein